MIDHERVRDDNVLQDEMRDIAVPDPTKYYYIPPKDTAQVEACNDFKSSGIDHDA